MAWVVVLASALACNTRDKEPHEGVPDSRGDEGRASDRVEPGSAGSVAAPSCAAPSGRYQAAFAQRTGSCGPFALDDAMPLDNSISIAKFADRDVETESFVDNCSVNLKHVVIDRATGHVRLVMRGDALELDAGGTTARGSVSLHRFDPIGALSCSGDYDITLTKAEETAGAATGP